MAVHEARCLAEYLLSFRACHENTCAHFFAYQRHQYRQSPTLILNTEFTLVIDCMQEKAAENLAGSDCAGGMLFVDPNPRPRGGGGGGRGDRGEIPATFLQCLFILFC